MPRGLWVLGFRDPPQLSEYTPTLLQEGQQMGIASFLDGQKESNVLTVTLNMTLDFNPCFKFGTIVFTMKPDFFSKWGAEGMCFAFKHEESSLYFPKKEIRMGLCCARNSQIQLENQTVPRPIPQEGEVIYSVGQG
jgi:hypothetical protein